MKIVYLIGLLYAVCCLNSANGLEKEYFELYNDCSVYRVFIKDQNDFDMLQLIERRANQEFDYWTEPRLNDWVDIMIKPSMKQNFEKVMSQTNMKYAVTIKNVGELVKTQIELNNQHKPNKIQKLEDFDYGKYHTLDEINSWMNVLEKTYPKYVTVFNVSKSYEKRDIYAIKISIPTASKKPAIWFDGGIHAREWISPATVIYMANAV
jgi:carboxypeptidase A4